MNKQLNILMVYPEIAPFVQTGDIAEIGGTLPRLLKNMGHDVRLIVPQYRVINERKYILRDVIRLQNIEVPFGNRSITINVKSAFMPDSRVQVYFIDYKPFFNRKGIYRHHESGNPFPDNDKRFILFSRGVLETLKKLQWQPDVIHCNGWQSGTVPLYLKTCYRDDAFFRDMSSMFTVHDLGEDGTFDAACISSMALGDAAGEVMELVKNNRFSFLQAGMAFSDTINTVSDVIVETLTAGKKRKAPALSASPAACTVIPPGAVSDHWNPENDQLVQECFSVKNPAGRTVNREALIESLSLQDHADHPLVLIQQEVNNTGFFRLVLDTAEALLKAGVNLLFIYRDERWLQELKRLQKKQSGRIGLIDGRDERLLHGAFSGSDLILSISNYPEAGLAVFRAMAYGVIPIVYVTGAFRDVLAPVSSAGGSGNSFIIEALKSDNLVKAVKAAVRYLKDEKGRKELVKSCMTAARSWQSIAEAFIVEYAQCIVKADLRQA
ncbi:glycogen/starch synthase [bacterium]|nr:glycogen/starch synthase [bacterium]